MTTEARQQTKAADLVSIEDMLRFAFEAALAELIEDGPNPSKEHVDRLHMVLTAIQHQQAGGLQ